MILLYPVPLKTPFRSSSTDRVTVLSEGLSVFLCETAVVEFNLLHFSMWLVWVFTAP